MLKKTTVVLLSFLLLFTLALVGCGAGGTSELTNNTTTNDELKEQPNVEPGGPKRDDLVIGSKSALDVADPHYSYRSEYLDQIYDPLLRINANNELVPCLAERWEISEDGLEYTFNLKEGVKFHNGYDFTAKDVKFSFERAAASPYVGMVYTMMDRIEIIDDYTVKLILKYPYSPFLSSIGSSMGAVISEQYVNEVGEEFGKTIETAIGTGPYVLTEWEIGSTVKMQSFENYHKGPAPIKNLEYNIFMEDSMAVIGLETGEIDIYFNIPAIDINNIKSNKSLKFDENSSTKYYYLAMNHSNELFSNEKVRKAIAYAVDRESAFIIASEGNGELANNPISPRFKGMPDDVPDWYENNPEEAKRLLAEAGYPDGLDICIKVPGYEKIAQVVQESLSQIGINVEIQLQEVSTFVTEVCVNGDYDMSIFEFGALVPDADTLYLHFHENSYGVGGNYSRYIDSEMNELLDQGRKELDTQKREEIYSKVINKFKNEVIQIPLYYPNVNIAYNKDLKGVKVSSTLALNIYDLSW